MAHIINKIDVISRIEARTKQLCCMGNIKENTKIHDTESINKKIKEAAKIKQQLEKDIFERNNKLKDININR